MKDFKTNNVIVRRFELDDVEQAYYNLGIHKDVSDIGNYKVHTNIYETKSIIESNIKEYYSDEPVWAVKDNKNNNLVGFVKITNYSIKNKMCEIVWTMAHEYWNTYFMREALIKVMNFLFIERKIELIQCTYYETNKISGAILESLGMQKDAILRDRRINEITKQKENFVICSINKQEFYNKNDRKLIKTL